MKEFVVAVHESNWNLFILRFEEINKKFAKKKLPLISYEITDESDSVKTVTIKSTFNQSNIKGINVNFEGVVSLIDMDENSKVFTFSNPLIPTFLKSCSCDECHKKIGRSKYLVFSKTDDVKSRDDLIVLGTKCSTNYFPFNLESYFMGLSEEFDDLYKELDEYHGSGSFLSNSYDLSELFYVTGMVTDNFKTYISEGGTKEIVLDIMDSKKPKKFYEPATIEFSQMKEWLNDAYKVTETSGSFENNIHSVIFDGETLRTRISKKFVGLAIYSFVGARKFHEKMEQKKLDAIENSKVEYYGNVGDKFELSLTFDKSFGFETQFGYNYIHLFRDDENHVFKWSTSNGTYLAYHKTNGRSDYLDFESGKKYTIKGTIKAHEEYKGMKQTVITRCKVTKDPYDSHVFNPKDVEKVKETVEIYNEKGEMLTYTYSSKFHFDVTYPHAPTEGWTRYEVDDDKNRYLTISDDGKYHVWENKNQRYEDDEQFRNFFHAFRFNDDKFRARFDISLAMEEIN